MAFSKAMEKGTVGRFFSRRVSQTFNISSAVRPNFERSPLEPSQRPVPRASGGLFERHLAADDSGTNSRDGRAADFAGGRDEREPG